jgi:diguanylate cyclase (GGDEF)-like protein/PAS domain S-box-containing protein
VLAGHAHASEFRISTRHGTVRWLRDYAYPQRDDAGQVIRIIGAASDITAHKQAEETYQVLVDHSLQGLVILQGGRICFANPVTTTILGYTLPELQAMSPHTAARLIYADDRPAVLHALRTHRHVPATHIHYHFRVYCNDGTIRWLEAFTTGISYQDAPAVQMGAIDISERLQAEQALMRSESIYRTMFERNQAVKLLIDPQTGAIVDANPAAAQFYGYPRATLLTMHITDINILPQEQVQLEMERARTEQRLYFNFRHRLASGTVRDVEVYSSPIHIEGRSLLYSIVHDVTERRRTEEALHHLNTRLANSVYDLRKRNQDLLLLSELDDTILACSAVEEAFAPIATTADRLFNGQPGILYLQNSHGRLLPAAWWGHTPVAPPDEYTRICWALRQETSHVVESAESPLCCTCTNVISGDETIFPYICVPLTTQDETIGVLHLREGPDEPTVLRQHWERLAETFAGQVALSLSHLRMRIGLQEQALHDPLTGLFNRRYLDTTLKRELHRAYRDGSTVAIVLLDIDYFKQFNTDFGHDGGDAMLRSVGALLRANIRESDVPCRYGGEEFLLILPGVSAQDAQQRAEYLREAVQELQVSHRGMTLHTITISAGVAVFPTHGTNIETLTKAADRALYQAKASGRNQVICATPAYRLEAQSTNPD